MFVQKRKVTKVVLDVTLYVLSSVYIVFIVNCVIMVFFFNKESFFLGKKIPRHLTIHVLIII